MHGRTLALVEEPNLNEGAVDVSRLFSTKSPDLASQLAFRRPAHAGVAGHLCDVVEADGKQQRATAHPGCCQSGLAPGVTCTHHNHVVCIIHAVS